MENARAPAREHVYGALVGHFGAPVADGVMDAIDAWMAAIDAADGAGDEDGIVRDELGTEAVADDEVDEGAPGERARLNPVIAATEEVALYFYRDPAAADDDAAERGVVDVASPEFQAFMMEVREIMANEYD